MRGGIPLQQLSDKPAYSNGAATRVGASARSLPFWDHLVAYGIDRAAAHLARRIEAGGPDDCWPFKCTASYRYGNLCLGYRQLYAHRIAWALAHKRDPGKMLVCHTCDNPRCCNPAHLFLGTDADNMRDMHAKGRAVQVSLLTREQAIAIRDDQRPHSVIAAEYGVTAGHVSNIKIGHRWRSIRCDTEMPDGEIVRAAPSFAHAADDDPPLHFTTVHPAIFSHRRQEDHGS